MATKLRMAITATITDNNIVARSMTNKENPGWCKVTTVATRYFHIFSVLSILSFERKFDRCRWGMMLTFSIKTLIFALTRWRSEFRSKICEKTTLSRRYYAFNYVHRSLNIPHRLAQYPSVCRKWSGKTVPPYSSLTFPFRFISVQKPLFTRVFSALIFAIWFTFFSLFDVGERSPFPWADGRFFLWGNPCFFEFSLVLPNRDGVMFRAPRALAEAFSPCRTH